jgi:hypothetical protein
MISTFPSPVEVAHAASSNAFGRGGSAPRAKEYCGISGQSRSGMVAAGLIWGLE